MESITLSSEFQAEVNELLEAALKDLPEELNESQAMAWTARRMLEISELSRRKKQTVQVLLSSWIVNGELGQIWMAHPDNPETFRDFLKSVGNERDNNQLAGSTISDIVAVAEYIVPFCRDKGIAVDGFITTKLWTKFREAIPIMRQASTENDTAAMLNVLKDVKALPNRNAVRAKYREQRDTHKVAISDRVSINGKSVVITVVDAEHLSEIKAALSRVTDWQTIAAAQDSGDRLANIKVEIS